MPQCLATPNLKKRPATPGNGKTLVRPLNHLKRVSERALIDKQTNDAWMPQVESQQQPNNDIPNDTDQSIPSFHSPDRVQRPVGLRNTIDVGQFRQRVLGQGQSTNNQQPSSPNPIYTGSGRLVRPVVGQRLIDQINS